MRLFLVFIDRPLVQVQFLALGIILLLATAIEFFARNRIDQALANIVNARELPHHVQRIYKLLKAIRFLNFSASGLLLLASTTLLFERLNQPTTILRQVIPIFLLILTYQGTMAILHLRVRPTIIQPLHQYVFSPLFALFLLLLVTSNFIDLERVGNVLLFSAFGAGLTIGQLFQVALTCYAIFVVAYLLQKTTEQVMQQRTEQRSSSAIASVLVIVRFVVLVLGAFVLAGVLGIDASTLALIGGGLSVGIGIGLQNVVANFVSGIILIFEQSLRPGDVIDINGKIGTVSDLNIRATTIRTNDNVELVIPNDRFFSSEVVTYTKDNPLVRVELPFGVSYKSDPKTVRDLAVATVERHGLVSKKHTPTVQFMGFGDSALNFRLLVWMERPQLIPVFRSDLYFMLWDALQAQHIEIPFPQRDLNLGSGWQDVFRPAAQEEGNE